MDKREAPLQRVHLWSQPVKHFAQLEKSPGRLCRLSGRASDNHSIQDVHRLPEIVAATPRQMWHED